MITRGDKDQLTGNTQFVFQKKFLENKDLMYIVLNMMEGII